MRPIPAHTFIEPWNPLSCRCKLAVNGAVYDVVRWTAPVAIVRYTARKDGVVVAERAKFGFPDDGVETGMAWSDLDPDVDVELARQKRIGGA